MPAKPRQQRAAEGHFRKRGAAEGKKPNVYFDESWYRIRYPDVAQAIARGDFAHGFDHFRTGGLEEGFEPTPLVVDGEWYAHQSGAEVLEDPNRSLEHYLFAGARQGLSPHSAFAESWYLERYPDVAQAVSTGLFLCGYQHFLEAGHREGRQPHPQFGESYYRFRNPDVDAEILLGRHPSGYHHLIRHGLREGRPWRMDAVDFRQATTDLASLALEEFSLADATFEFPVLAEPEVSILLVLWNRAELTFRCLQSLLQIRDVGYEVVIVDNCSTDRTRELLSRVRGAEILLNDENVGYTRAANQAAAAARGRYLLNLNNDTEVLPDSLRAAVDRLEKTPDAGAVGGRIVTLDGRLQEAGSLIWSHGGSEGYGRGDDPQSGAYRFPRYVDYCSGVFLLTPRKLFERFGGYDLLFTPAYYEESDYCFRLREHGYETIYEPDAVVIHFETASLADTSERTELLRKNRRAFAERHAEALKSRCSPDPDHFFPASNLRPGAARVLVLDDYVPLDRLGGGSPRTRELLLALGDLGCGVTFFATNPVSLDRREVRESYPEFGFEFIDHLGRGHFLDFWRRRGPHYDLMIVSRWHNFERLLAAGFDPADEDVHVVYDSEAVVSTRIRLGEQTGLGVPTEGPTLEEEQSLARRADEIWAVSQEEGELLAGRDRPHRVVSFGIDAAPGPAGFADRTGLLFVGRLDEEWNPNVDALRWYLRRIHPRVAELLAGEGLEPPVLTVVGHLGDYDLPDADGVRYLGRVDRLDEIFDRHRVFVAPTRFAAGIPHKVVNAAAHGLPVVATSLLARQLGWQDGDGLADGGDDDPEAFARAVARVYTQETLWHTLRSSGQRRARKEHGPETLRQILAKSLAPFLDSPPA